MTEPHIQEIRGALERIGYVPDLVLEDYAFSDLSPDSGGLKAVDVVAFGQRPPSYRSACIGVSFSHLEPRYFSMLGAPILLRVESDAIEEYSYTSDLQAFKVTSHPFQPLAGLIEQRADLWSPGRVLSAKTFAESNRARQLDFYDAGFLPAIEEIVRSKLDVLLRETLGVVAVLLKKNDRRSYSTQRLYRLVFRLLAAKVLQDKGAAAVPQSDEDPRSLLSRVARHYGMKDANSDEGASEHVLSEAWRSISSSIHFHNLAVDDLAYIYETTFVSREARGRLGIHATPPGVAEFIMRSLPLERISIEDRRVFEPFAGHAVFLVAALRRLRELLPAAMTNESRHRYLVERLHGIEKDDFAHEVAMLSLILADFPNTNGWDLVHGDVFESQRYFKELNAADVVLSNPPFEAFSPDEKKRYGERVQEVYKPEQLLRSLIELPKPPMLGLVLPRRVVDSRSSSSLRADLSSTYDTIETTMLPAGAFEHSDAEVVLLVAHGAEGGRKVNLKSNYVDQRHLQSFLRDQRDSAQVSVVRNRKKLVEDPALWLNPLVPLWELLEENPTLASVATIHRGIEWNESPRVAGSSLASDYPREGYHRGVRSGRALSQFIVNHTVHLDLRASSARGGAYRYEWSKPKVLLNAHPIGRGPWRLAAAVDREGLAAVQTLHGIWTVDLPLEVLAAILNSPIANAHVFFREGKRDLRVETLNALPLPLLDGLHRRSSYIVELVRRTEKILADFVEPESGEAQRLLLELDAAILSLYDLPPRLERQLLDLFDGYQRPVAVRFAGYIPLDLTMDLTLAEYLVYDPVSVAADTLLRRVKPLRDPLMHDVLSRL